MSETKNNKPKVTAKEACAILGGISLMTLRRRVEAGKITPVPVPAVLQRPAKLEFYLEDVERLRDSS